MTPTSNTYHPDTEQLLTNYAWEMKKNGRKETTITSIYKRLKLIAKTADLTNPESVKVALLNLKWKDSTKSTAVNNYTSFLKFLGKTWNCPHYIRQEEIYFLPTEQEIDALINASNPTLATLLHLLKETGARIGEACQIEWKDVNFEQKTVAINHPEKRSLPRLLPISEKLILMLKQLPQQTEKPIFQATTTQHGLQVTLDKTKHRTAKKLGNPRLNQIHFHTFRHYKATAMFLDLRDQYEVRMQLGHKTAEMTDRYIHIAKALLPNSETWEAKISQNEKEEMELIAHGYTLVRDRGDGTAIYKHRK